MLNYVSQKNTSFDKNHPDEFGVASLKMAQ